MHFDEENSEGLTLKEREQILSLIEELEAFESRAAARRPPKNPKASHVPLGPDCKALGKLQLTRRTR